jgi:hypothetical protein
MTSSLYVSHPGSPAPVWPSIASASAQLRRPRRLEVVPARAENPAVPGRAARPRPLSPGARQR